MKRFIKLILLFLLPILFIAITIEVTLRRIPNDYSYKHSYLNKHSQSIEVVVLGNSHFFFGINPKYFKENTFNAAHVSQSLNYDNAIVQKYKNDWTKLKCIVIPIDYFSMYLVLDQGVESWRVKNYNIYYGIYKSKSLEDNFEIVGGKLDIKLKRIYSFILHKSVITCDSLGWGTTYHSSESKNLDTTGKVAALRHKKQSGYEKCFVENMEALKEIISFARERNIKIVFVTSPAYKTYRDCLEPSQLSATISTVTQLTTLNPNTYYYNLLSNESFNGADFYDADHLNEKGAEKLSLMVDSLININ